MSTPLIKDDILRQLVLTKKEVEYYQNKVDDIRKQINVARLAEKERDWNDYL